MTDLRVEGERIWPDLATLRATIDPQPVETDDGGSTRLLLVRMDNPAGDLVDTAVFADLDLLGRRLATRDDIAGVVLTGRGPGHFAPHFRLGDIADGAEDLGRPVPAPLARIAYSAVAGLTRAPQLEQALLGTAVGGVVELARTHRALSRLGSLPQVVVAAIDGDALGGGCELALACDLRVMARGDGRIGLVEVTAGIPPGAGGTQRLARAVGPARARSMILRATTVDADKAYDLGLVDEVCSPDELLATARSVAAQVARRNPDAVRAVKVALQGGRVLDAGLATEAGGFMSAASRPRAITRLRAFAAASDPRGSRTPWRDRTWLR